MLHGSNTYLFVRIAKHHPFGRNMLYPEGVPRGFRKPIIPFLKAQLVDGEEITWNVAQFGAVAIRCMCIYKKHDIVLIAGKIGPFYDASTGIWKACDAHLVSKHGMTMETFLQKNDERPWGLRMAYGFRSVGFLRAVPACANSDLRHMLRGFKQAFKRKFFDARLVLNNPKRLNALVHEHVRTLNPLPPLAMLLPAVSGNLAVGSLVPVWLALKLPTLLAAIATRACHLAGGAVDVSKMLTCEQQQQVVADLIWAVSYEPLRAALTTSSSPKGASAKNVPANVRAEAAQLMARIKSMRRQKALRASEEAAKVMPMCLLSKPFNNKARVSMANTLRAAGASVDSALVEELSDDQKARVKQFYAAVEWASKHTEVHPPSCHGMRHRCPFATFENGFAPDHKQCARNMATRSGVADIEDLAFRLDSPVTAIKFGLMLKK